LVEKLKNEGVTVVSIEQAENATPLQDFEVSSQKRYAIVLGNEVKGVQQSVVSASDHCIEIPQFGTKHSLNISVTAGVVLWSFLGKLKL
jgi:tRNA G18 (ribose-2'-O)-methylase SpoU